MGTKIKKFLNPSGSLSPEYLQYQKNKNINLLPRNQGEIIKKETILNGTWLGDVFDKAYSWSNKNYTNGLKGAFVRAVDGARNLYNDVRYGGLSFIPGVGDAVDVVSIGDDVNKGNYGSAALTASLMVLPGSAGKVKQLGKRFLNRTGHRKILKAFSKKMSKNDILDELDLEQKLYPERFTTIQPRQLYSDDFNAPNDYVSNRWKEYEDEMWELYGELVDTPSPLSLKIFDLYANAMTRKRDYVWTGLPHYLDNDGLYGIKRNNSVVFGHPSNYTNLFTASHFAPENLREGYELIKSMGSSKVPIMFAVPPDLSKQLVKSNFRKVIEVPLIFNGKLMMKDVMINKSVTPDILETEFKNNSKLQLYINDDVINIIRLKVDDLQFNPINYGIGNLIFKQGGSIHIKEKNKGSFTKYCKGKVTEECIKKGKNSPNPKIRKKATFAANARKWKHLNGGIINYLNIFTNNKLK